MKYEEFILNKISSFSIKKIIFYIFISGYIYGILFCQISYFKNNDFIFKEYTTSSLTSLYTSILASFMPFFLFYLVVIFQTVIKSMDKKAMLVRSNGYIIVLLFVFYSIYDLIYYLITGNDSSSISLLIYLIIFGFFYIRNNMIVLKNDFNNALKSSLFFFFLSFLVIGIAFGVLSKIY